MIYKTRTQPPSHVSGGDTLADRQKSYLAMKDGYLPGAIISHSWGFDQTNVDFYHIEKRNGEWVTLIPIGSNITENGFMAGTATPIDQPKASRKRLRKKLKFQKGKPTGIAAWHGARLWNATPERCSWDA